MKFLAQLQYMYKNQKLQMGITFGIFISIVFLVNSPFGQANFDLWTNSLSAVIGMTTFSIAFFVWFSESARNWENKLPKKLTVTFKYQFPKQEDWKLVMQCSHAFLAGEGDIRQWAQQIGRQMNNDKLLSFLPFMELKIPNTQKKGQKWYKFYEVTIYLTKMPDLGTEEGNRNLDSQYLHWTSKLEQPEDFEKKWVDRV